MKLISGASAWCSTWFLPEAWARDPSSVQVSVARAPMQSGQYR
jgi:hypothetical protein